MKKFWNFIQNEDTSETELTLQRSHFRRYLVGR